MKAKEDLRDLAAAIEAHTRAHGRVPETLDCLSSTTDPGPLGMDLVLLDRVDAWDHPYVYERVGSRGFRVTCYGADGAPGGTNADADIVLATAE